jgi:iron complex outermembrane receptor protein
MLLFTSQSRARRASNPAAWLLAGLLLSTASAAYAQTAAAPADAASVAADDGDDGDAEANSIVVTARNKNERLQDVPIPISVLNGETIAQQRVFTIADLSQRAPGLTATTPNARRTGVSLRGIGKTSGNDNMEAAVGVIVDDVFLGHVGMTYQDFTDLEQVEIARGPQGTLLGKNTSLGVIKYTSKAPSFSPEGTLELEGGLSTPAFKARGSFSDKIIEDVLAFRASFSYDHQDGDIFNINPAVGGRWHERNRWAGRFQLLFKPTDTLSVRLNIDGAETNENSNTKPFMIDPKTLNDGSTRSTTYTTRLARSYFGGYTPVIGSWNTIDMDQALPLITRNYGASLVATLDVGDLQIKSITAGRKFHFDANNDSEQTRFAIARGGTLVNTEQYSQELRLSGNISPTLDFQAGLYFFRIETDTNSRNLYGKDAGAFYATNDQYRTLSTALLQQSLQNVFSVNNQHPISNSQAVFAQANWKATERATLTAGIRYTREQKTSTTVRTATYYDGTPLVSTGSLAADSIRTGQTGAAYTTIIGEPIDTGAISWLVNPSYKVTDDILLYASASGGGKSGAVAFDNNGKLRNVRPEKTTDFELGVKGSFLDRHLSISANLYWTKVRDYQATTTIEDGTSATGFSSVLGNIPALRARGVELDGVLQINHDFAITFGGSYNDATYTDWSTATCPRSYPTSVLFCNNTGKQLVGAPKWTAIVGFDFRHELIPGLAIHAFANDTYRSSHNLEQLLSPYGWQKAYHLTDAGIGFQTRIRGADTELSIVAKNLFDTQYTTSVNDFSNNAPVGYDGIGARRYVGALLRTKF